MCVQTKLSFQDQNGQKGTKVMMFCLPFFRPFSQTFTHLSAYTNWVTERTKPASFVGPPTSIIVPLGVAVCVLDI